MITLKKETGNILDFNVDFLVNASNTNLRLGSGVSMVLKRACGPQLQIQMNLIREEVTKNNRNIQQGEVFATPSYDLSNAKYILHAAVINYNIGVKQFEGKPSIETIELILNNCIPYWKWFEKEYSKVPVALFPYLGCGVGGLEKQDVQIVFDEFIKKRHKNVNATIVLVKWRD